MSWDEHMKALLKESPQDFVSLFLKGARFIEMSESQFQTREIRSDTMMKAEYKGQEFIINVEFQSKKDDEMDERLLAYSFEIARLYKLPVLACVIYLHKVHDAPKPPLVWILPNGREVLWFDYESLELTRQTVDHFRRLGLDGFWPLALLSKDGASFEFLIWSINSPIDFLNWSSG